MSGDDPTEHIEAKPERRMRWERMAALICLLLVVIVGLDARHLTVMTLLSVTLYCVGLVFAVRTCLARQTRTFGVLLLGLYLLILLVSVLERWSPWMVP